jgi:uncharacterized protein YjiK
VNIKPYFQIISLIVISTTLTTFSCKKSDPVAPDVPIVTEGTLTLLATYPLLVTEPSGLSFGPDSESLLTVSDNTNEVFEISLTGEILKTWDYQGNDLEGVTFNPNNRTIAITEERERNVVILDYDSNEILGDYHINIPMGSENSGLEGIAFNNNNQLYYMLNETNPGELILWTPADGIISETDLTFAEDYSGIYVDTQASLLWIVSDLSKYLYACNYKGEPQTKYRLNASKFEGVVVDHATQTLYMVNDAAAQLSIYHINNN